MFRRKRSTKSLTEVTVISLSVDVAHGNVPASSPADSSVARSLTLQGRPGHPRTPLHHSNSIVGGGQRYKRGKKEGDKSENNQTGNHSFWLIEFNLKVHFRVGKYILFYESIIFPALLCFLKFSKRIM